MFFLRYELRVLECRNRQSGMRRDMQATFFDKNMRLHVLNRNHILYTVSRHKEGKAMKIKL